MKGTITMDLGFNFDRTYNTPLNPRYIQFNDLNITYSSQPPSLQVEGKTTSHKIFGDFNLTRNVTFVYGRAKPNRFFYDDITTNTVTTPVSIVVYCDLGLTECQNRSLTSLVNGLLSEARSNEANWFMAEKHNSTTGDGNITLSATNGSIAPTDPTPLSFSDGIDESIIVTNGGSTPNIVNIDLGSNTDRWLIYNKDANSNPSPFYRVRFIGSSGWTGEGQTGHVVGDDINVKKSKRLEW
jgi:hypothetical protein